MLELFFPGESPGGINRRRMLGSLGSLGSKAGQLMLITAYTMVFGLMAVQALALALARVFCFCRCVFCSFVCLANQICLPEDCLVDNPGPRQLFSCFFVLGGFGGEVCLGFGGRLSSPRVDGCANVQLHERRRGKII